MPVIKRDELEDKASGAASAEVPPGTTGPRIPRDRINPDALDTPDLTSFASAGAGVVNRDNAALQVEPYVIPTPELDPDHPLPDDYDHTPDTLPEEETDEAPDDEAERTNDEWQEELERATEEAHAAGYEEGYAEGEADGYEEGYAAAEDELRAAYESEVQAMANQLAQLETRWEAWLEELEPHFVEMSLEIAELLLDAPLPESVQGASARAIAEAIESLAGTTPLQVDLHPVDYQRLDESGLIEQLDANHGDQLRWNPDPELAEGDWSVESTTAVVRHVRAELLATLRDRLNTLPTPPSGAAPDDPPPASDAPSTNHPDA